MDFVAVVILAVVGGIYLLTGLFVVPYVAKAKGRNWFTWLLAGLVITPPIALLALAALPDDVVRRRLRRIDRALRRDQEAREPQRRRII